MRQYFFDRKVGELVAFDTETLEVERLQRVGERPPLDAAPRKNRDDAAAAPVEKRKYTKRGFSDSELFPTKKAKRGPCPECGSGSKHKANCSRPARGGSSFSAQSGPSPMIGQPLSQMTFGRVKISQSHGIPAEQIARNLDVDVAEVEKAFEYETYSEYRAA